MRLTLPTHRYKSSRQSERSKTAVHCAPPVVVVICCDATVHAWFHLGNVDFNSNSSHKFVHYLYSKFLRNVKSIAGKDRDTHTMDITSIKDTDTVTYRMQKKTNSTTE